MLVHTKNQPTISSFFTVFETCFVPNALGNVGATISSSALVSLQCSFEDDALSATGKNNSQYIYIYIHVLYISNNTTIHVFEDNGVFFALVGPN